VTRSSLRSRVFLGAVLWTFGLFAGGVLLTTIVFLRHPGSARALHGTFSTHAAMVTLFVLVCMVVGFWQVRRGLSPIEQLRARLGAVREGQRTRVDGQYPSEVQPLVDDLNALLEHRERTVTRALAKAGDLAHGLKTPLAVIAHEAERARAAGYADLASAIDQQVERMRRQTEFHLAQARAAASGSMPGARCAVVDSSEALARTLRTLNADRGVAIEERVDHAHAVRCEREDLDEMLGNLLDNACKWARSRVLMQSVREGEWIVVTVEDDGPGLPPEKRAAALTRGVRLDEAGSGSGLGLAIVGDLVELYGGSVSLQGSPLGGLCARLQLPSC
jgi:signal transduction histidine kinase